MGILDLGACMDSLLDFDGYVHNIDAFKVAVGCKILGAGREKKSDDIDLSVGVYLNKKTSEKVVKGDVLYTIFSNDENKTAQCRNLCSEAYEISPDKPQAKPLVYDIVQ